MRTSLYKLECLKQISKQDKTDMDSANLTTTVTHVTSMNVDQSVIQTEANINLWPPLPCIAVPSSSMPTTPCVPSHK